MVTFSQPNTISRNTTERLHRKTDTVTMSTIACVRYFVKSLAIIEVLATTTPLGGFYVSFSPKQTVMRFFEYLLYVT